MQSLHQGNFSLQPMESSTGKHKHSEGRAVEPRSSRHNYGTLPHPRLREHYRSQARETARTRGSGRPKTVSPHNIHKVHRHVKQVRKHMESLHKVRNPTHGLQASKGCWDWGESSSETHSLTDNCCLCQPGLLSPWRLDSAILLTHLRSLSLIQHAGVLPRILHCPSSPQSSPFWVPHISPT